MLEFGKGLAKCQAVKTSPENHGIKGIVPIEMLVKLKFHNRLPHFFLLYQFSCGFSIIYM